MFPFNQFCLAVALKHYILGTLDLLKNRFADPSRRDQNPYGEGLPSPLPPFRLGPPHFSIKNLNAPFRYFALFNQPFEDLRTHWANMLPRGYGPRSPPGFAINFGW